MSRVADAITYAHIYATRYRFHDTVTVTVASRRRALATQRTALDQLLSAAHRKLSAVAVFFTLGV